MGGITFRPWMLFVGPAIVGGIVGILLAASHERLSLVVVLTLVALTAGIAAQPLLYRELTHAQARAALPPYAQLREEAMRRMFRGPSIGHTRDLLLLSSNAYDLHFRFRPILIDVVSDLLALRARIDFHEHPEQAHELLGPVLWDLVRPDRPVPAGRFSDPGLDARSMQRLLDELERISG
jgi:hypothetical protein